jgi:UDP-GlcNAc:undecaprenyl-phosphate GlcNAc-1-phosphate transferase
MLDNMDSITNLTSLSIISGALIYSLMFNPIEYNLLQFVMIAIVGAMLSFLIYNWNPSKMYMGDSGSQFLGTFLAFIGIVVFWNAVPISEFSYGYNTKQIAIVALAFVVPITDTTTVTINRLLKKKSPFVGGRDHTTHHLSYLGLSDRWIATVLFTLSIIGNFLSYRVILLSTDWNNSIFGLFIIYPIFVFLILYANTKISKPK